jgi:PBP1b-binding outer membrane lipoprotein LpoB
MKTFRLVTLLAAVLGGATLSVGCASSERANTAPVEEVRPSDPKPTPEPKPIEPKPAPTPGPGDTGDPPPDKPPTK